MMRQGLRLVGGLAILLAAALPASGQYFPYGYRSYGWGGWGANPTSGLMAGLGAYSRGQGAYVVDQARANAINTDTVLKWNQALRARQRELDQQRQQEQAQQEVENEARAHELAIENGTILNALLDRIYEFNSGGTKAYAASAPLSPDAIRDIPFESATEALTICLDQMTAEDGWPDLLQEDRFEPGRQALRQAVLRALDEDRSGEVSPATITAIQSAISRLRDQLQQGEDLSLESASEDEFLKGLAGLAQMLHNPGLQQMLAQLETYRGSTIGDLLAFMQSYNLRFGSAQSDQQKDLYHQLIPMLESVLTDVSGQGPSGALARGAPPRDSTGKPFRAAARQAFRGLQWDELTPPPAPQP